MVSLSHSLCIWNRKNLIFHGQLPWYYKNKEGDWYYSYPWGKCIKIFSYKGFIFSFKKQALIVPSQGFLNAVAYGWTRGDFLSVMSVRRYSRTLPDSISTSYEAMEEEEEETEVEDEREDWEKGFPVENSLLFSSNTTGWQERYYSIDSFCLAIKIHWLTVQL